MSEDSISECVKAGVALAEIRNRKFKPIPNGWFSFEMFMEDQKCGKTFARSAISTLLKFNKLKTQKWPSLDGRGHTYYMTIYKTK